MPRTKSYRKRKSRRKPPGVVAVYHNKALMSLPNLKNQIYPFIIKDQSTPSTQTAGSATHGALTIRIDNIANAAEYAALFDQYQIVKASITFHPINQEPAVTTTTTLGVNEIFFAVVVDLDDSNLLTTYDQYFEYSNVKYQRIYDQRRLTVTFVPRTTSLVTSTAGSDRETKANRWIDCSGTDVIHYGVKYFLPAGVASNLQSWLISSKIWINFRNTR